MVPPANCPLVAQLLYKMGLEYKDEDDDAIPEATMTSPETNSVPWPPMILIPALPSKWKLPPECYITPLPLQESVMPMIRAAPMHRPTTAVAARVSFDPANDSVQTPEAQQGPKISKIKLPHDIHGVAARTKAMLAAELVSEYLITKCKIAPIYMSPCPYFDAFEEVIDLRKFDLGKHKMAGLCLAHIDGWLFLGGIAPSTPGAKIPCWRTWIKGVWLIKVSKDTVSTIDDAQKAFQRLLDSGTPLAVLLFSHPKIRPDMMHDGLPIISSTPFHQHIHNQMNRRWDFESVAEYLRKAPPYTLVNDGNVLNCVTKVMKLTQGKLIQQEDWNDWLQLEYLQLDQYHAQGMFGLPVATAEGNAIFHLVWI
jgi:hypothetical protein